ncbi:hypothetical protein [Aeromonas veronii]|uniref:hypothetical protein n=1 Tax=Aeromonas veronii TaxID=654 RepID=UPI003D1C3FE1
MSYVVLIVICGRLSRHHPVPWANKAAQSYYRSRDRIDSIIANHLHLHCYLAASLAGFRGGWASSGDAISGKENEEEYKEAEKNRQDGSGDII